MTNRNIGLMIAAIAVVLGFATCGIIIGAQRQTITDKNNMIATIKARAEIDLTEEWEAAENEKQKAEQDLYEMSVDDVLNLFMPEGIHVVGTAYYDGIFAEQVRSFKSVLQSLGLCIAKVKPEN